MVVTAAGIMETLLEEAHTAGMVREHTLEQMHYASANVEQVMDGKYDELVTAVENEWGAKPEQNVHCQRYDGAKTPLPKWLHESTNVAGHTKLLRVAFWKRGVGVCFIMLRAELDSKDRVNSYNLILAARRRQSEGARVGKLRQERPWWSWFVPGYKS